MIHLVLWDTVVDTLAQSLGEQLCYRPALLDISLGTAIW